VSWYVTLVTNTDTYPDAPSVLGGAVGRPPQLARPAGAARELVPARDHRATFFGGTDVLDTEEGILQVIDKLTELQPNVQLWYRDEGQFQQALQSGEIPMGQYYHDVTGIAADEGFPVRSTFPVEGGVLDSGSWAVSRASSMVDEAHVFIDWFSQPEVQDLVARMIGTAPTVEREFLSLTDEEFAFVSDAGDPIVPRYDMYLERGDWLNQVWTERVTR
jgi:putative spermidine/putrescine transport system substrate-binding protein